MVMSVWRRYLIAGLVVSAICIALPLGIGRDLLYCLIGFSGATAILAGVRRNRPAHPVGWYLIAAGTLVWVLGDGLYAWYQHVLFIQPFPSHADVLYLSAYALFAAGLLGLVQSGGRGRGSNALLDTAIFTVALALPSWLFLVTPTWAAHDAPILTRMVGVAYPFCDVLLFAMLMRLATSVGERNGAFRLTAGSVASLLAADSIFAVSAFVPAFAGHTFLLDFLWLASYVLWGAAALHPSMRALSTRATERIERMSTPCILALAAAVAVSPAIIVGELIAGVPVQNVTIAIASGTLVPLILVRIVRIVRQLENQAKRLEMLADTDHVTGLTNRRHFVERLNDPMVAANPKNNGIVLVQLEKLSELNDTLGHPTTDAILAALGARLCELAHPQALVGRMDSDRFGVLSPSITSDEQASQATASIQEAMECPLDLPGLPDLSVSVEVIVLALVLPQDGTRPELALLRAEAALSVARSRSQLTTRFGFGMETSDMLPPLIIGELREAIENGEIVVYYQPQVEIRSGHVSGVEALVRWQHPLHGLLGPDTFIPSAEQAGLLGPLTQCVLDSALHECAGWRRKGLDLTVAVNLSVRNLLDPGLVAEVRSALRRHGLQARSLELEITESSAMLNPRRSVEVLGELAELGVELSIDDYGTGHSSLAYLQKLPVGRLKIDRSFVTEMTVDRASAAIVKSTIQLARVLGFEVVAEGVQDDATLLRLRDMRCGTAQGFELGPPVEASLVPELIIRIEERMACVLGPPQIGLARPEG